VRVWGLFVTMKTFDVSRPGIGALAVGLSQGALDISVEYARKQVQFGKPIISFQAVQHMLADMATETEAARALVYAAARYIDNDAKEISKWSAISGTPFLRSIAITLTGITSKAKSALVTMGAGVQCGLLLPLT